MKVVPTAFCGLVYCAAASTCGQKLPVQTDSWVTPPIGVWKVMGTPKPVLAGSPGPVGAVGAVGGIGAVGAAGAGPPGLNVVGPLLPPPLPPPPPPPLPPPPPPLL